MSEAQNNPLLARRACSLLLAALLGGLGAGCGDEGGLDPPAQPPDAGSDAGPDADPDGNGDDETPDSSNILPDPDEPFEVAPPLIEDRLLEIGSRVELLREIVPLPEGLDGDSPLLTLGASPIHGHVSAGGAIFGVGRDGLLRPLLAGWDPTAPLGTALAAATLDDDEGLLISTDLGLLYRSEGFLWPSPLSSIVDGLVHAMLVERVFDPDGRLGLWCASDKGLFVIQGQEVFRVGPGGGVELDAAVDHMTLGPDLEDPLGQSIWVTYGQRLFALRPEGATVAAFAIDVDFGGPLIALGADRAGVVWTATRQHLFSRRPGPVLGGARWARWALPEGREALGVTVAADGAVWLHTTQGLYRTLDGQQWEAALVGPVSDVVAIAPSNQGGAWITRAGSLSHAFETPPVTLVGLEAGQALDSMPDLQVFPTLPDQVEQLRVQVDDCQPAAMDQEPYLVGGGGALWSDCLSPGAHALRIEVDYREPLPDTRLDVPFDWTARPETITWDEHVEPIYGRYCARSSCHVGGFKPDTYESWVEKIDNIITRTAIEAGQPGTMPPNGARPSEAELLLLRWWREDGLLR